MSKDRIVEKILQLVGSDVKQANGGKIIASCPFATWKHGGGTDRNPSFGVWPTRYGNWRYNCFTCQSKGDLRGLVWEYIAKSGRVPKGITALLYFDLYSEGTKEDEKPIPVKELSYTVGGKWSNKGAGRGYLSYEYKADTRAQSAQGSMFKLEPVKEPRPNSGSIFKWKSEEPPLEYLHKRNISLEAYRHFELGNNVRERRLMFPVRDLEQEFVGYTGRLYWEESFCFRDGRELGSAKSNLKCPKCNTTYVKYKHFKGSWRNKNVYGLSLCEPSIPIVVVEGSIDAIRLWELGVRNPVAILGANMSSTQAQLIASVVGSSKVYVMGDGDEAGRAMTDRCVSQFNDIGVDSEGVYIVEKDPDELCAEQLKSYLGSFGGYRYEM